jgi:proline iminopeptidase
MKTRYVHLGLLAFVAFASTWLTCAPLDVRLGVGDGEGVRLSYRIVGEGSPLVVIHDGPGYEKSLMYAGFDAFASEMRVVYYDQRGCGRSEPLTPTTSATIRDNVEDLEALRRYLHIDRFSVAAHGWGAVIALEYARKYGDRLESIVLVTPISPFMPEPLHETLMDKLPDETRMAVFDLLHHPTITMLERRQRIMRLTMPALFYRSDAARRVNPGNVRFAADVNLRLGDELGTLNMFPVLGEVTVPTLVVVGMHDISTTVRDQMAYADGIKGSSAVVFNESGHFPFLEEQDFFISVVRGFILEGRLPSLVQASR